MTSKPEAPNNALPLTGQRVLVTRPAHQADALCDSLVALGAEAIRFPTLSIRPTASDDPGYPHLNNCFLNLDQYQAVIFISANAAKIGYDWIDHYWPQLPLGTLWLAVGEATGRSLNQLGLPASVAGGSMDSEALLTLPQLQQISNAKILICRGHGGREQLADELRLRGAKVDYADLYHREIPVYSQPEIKSIIYKSAISAILVSSGEGLSNFLSLTKQSDSQKNVLSNTPLVVPSQRVAILAQQGHFNHIEVAANATDAAMIDALQALIATQDRVEY